MLTDSVSDLGTHRYLGAVFQAPYVPLCVPQSESVHCKNLSACVLPGSFTGFN